MVIEVIPIEYLNLIYIGIIATVGVIVLRQFSGMIKERFRQKRLAQGTIPNAQNRDMDSQINGFLDKSPEILNQVNAEIENQRSQGVTDEQMKSLISKKNMLEFVVQNKELIDIIGKPILGKLVGFIKAI